MLSPSTSDFGSEDGSMSDLNSFDNDERVGSEIGMDPSQSFVLPTLDFSSSSLASPAPPSHLSESDIDLISYASSNDSFSDIDSHSSSSGSDSGISSTFSFYDSSSSGDGSWAQPSGYGSSRFGFGFSSEFIERFGGGRDGEEGPREHLF